MSCGGTVLDPDPKWIKQFTLVIVDVHLYRCSVGTNQLDDRAAERVRDMQEDEKREKEREDEREREEERE